jgi:FtsP/CotA-like multicopper oxidase with cupredoxin domain
VRTIALNGKMKPYAWSLNGECWPHITPLMLNTGQRVEIELVNHSMMAHPMHLHGHAFQVVAVNGRRVQGAARDTVLVTPMGACASRSTRTIRAIGPSTPTTSIIWGPV